MAEYVYRICIQFDENKLKIQLKIKIHQNNKKILENIPWILEESSFPSWYVSSMYVIKDKKNFTFEIVLYHCVTPVFPGLFIFGLMYYFPCKISPYAWRTWSVHRVYIIKDGRELRWVRKAYIRSMQGVLKLNSNPNF